MRVIVVGAGIIGCSIAYELSRRGMHVRVIDRRQPGDGATQASAGVLAPYIEGHRDALRSIGVTSLALYDDFIARVTAESGAPVEYRRTGTLEIALTEDQAATLRAAAAQHESRGVEHRWLTGSDLRAAEPSVAASAHAGLLVPTHGYVRVGELMAALRTAAMNVGASFEPASAVRRVTAGEDGAEVVTGGSSLHADAVVIATGSWTGTLEMDGVEPAPVKPIRGQLLQLRCESPPMTRVLWGTDCYIVPWSDGSVLVGATVEDVGFDEAATASGVSGLLDAAKALLPTTWNARFTAVRVGLRPGTPDELPIVGRSSRFPAIVYAAGHYRNGILLAPLTAALVSSILEADQGPPELRLTRPERFGL